MWVLWALVGAFATGLTGVLTKVGTDKVDSTLVLAIQSIITLVLTWTIVGFSGKASDVLYIPGKAWPFIIGAGVVTTVAYFCYFRALSLGPASAVSPVDRLSLVFAVVLAGVILKEKVSMVAVAGVAMMAFGAILVAVAPQSK